MDYFNEVVEEWNEMAIEKGLEKYTVVPYPEGFSPSQLFGCESLPHSYQKYFDDPNNGFTVDWLDDNQTLECWVMNLDKK